MQVVHYFDYKSPYAYLAQEDTFRLSEEFDVELVCLPYTLDLADFMGRAEVDRQGNVIASERSAHQWRRVRYSYQDCRREARRRGLTVRGPRKIFDSSVAHIGYLYARRSGDPRPFHDRVYELFWRRELEDLENPEAIAAHLGQAGFDAGGFAGFLADEGRREHDRTRAEAEEKGVFGVPSYFVDNELFWGAERLPRVRELLEERRR